MPDTASMAARPFWISASSANETYMLGYGKGDVLNAMLKKSEILNSGCLQGFGFRTNLCEEICSMTTGFRDKRGSYGSWPCSSCPGQGGQRRSRQGCVRSPRAWPAWRGDQRTSQRNRTRGGSGPWSPSRRPCCGSRRCPVHDVKKNHYFGSIFQPVQSCPASSFDSMPQFQTKKWRPGRRPYGGVLTVLPP
jgi:hypothetical protein